MLLYFVFHVNARLTKFEGYRNPWFWSEPLGHQNFGQDARSRLDSQSPSNNLLVQWGFNGPLHLSLLDPLKASVTTNIDCSARC